MEDGLDDAFSRYCRTHNHMEEEVRGEERQSMVQRFIEEERDRNKEGEEER